MSIHFDRVEPRALPRRTLRRRFRHLGRRAITRSKGAPQPPRTPVFAPRRCRGLDNIGSCRTSRSPGPEEESREVMRRCNSVAISQQHSRSPSGEQSKARSRPLPVLTTGAGSVATTTCGELLPVRLPVTPRADPYSGSRRAPQVLSRSFIFVQSDELFPGLVRSRPARTRPSERL
jgi:hypothetical protein